MNAGATTESWTLPADAVEGGRGRTVLSLLLGAGFTLGLFLGIAYYEAGGPARPPPSVEDLRVVSMPLPPPPVDLTPPEQASDDLPMAGFEYAPSDSPVSLAVSPPDLGKLLPAELAKVPPVPHIGPVQFRGKPTMDLGLDTQHIYQKSEVDKIPTVLDHSQLDLPRKYRGDAGELHARFIIVVNTDGSVLSARVLHSSGDTELDAFLIDYVKEWTFSPAIRRGKHVRCMTEQAMTIVLNKGSLLSL